MFRPTLRTTIESPVVNVTLAVVLPPLLTVSTEMPLTDVWLVRLFNTIDESVTSTSLSKCSSSEVISDLVDAPPLTVIDSIVGMNRVVPGDGKALRQLPASLPNAVGRTRCKDGPDPSAASGHGERSS